MFKKDSKLITVVNNDTLYFIVFDHNSEMKIRHGLPLDQFLNHDPESGSFAEDLKTMDNGLLIIPDYWIGKASYKFQSKKRALAETFIERKLKSDYPDLSNIINFFEYTFHKTEAGEQFLSVIFLEEPNAFKLYDQLAALNFSPREMTTPAFLWEQKFKSLVSSFHEGGKGLIHLLATECFLCFFDRGSYVFSRTVAVSENKDQKAETSGFLTFEINQSIYLFSQKAKCEIEQLYLISSNKEDSREFSEMLGREVIYLPDLDQSRHADDEIVRNLGPAACFNAFDLSSARKFLSVSHKQIKAALEWHTVQITGIVIGLILLLLIGAESIYLWNWSQYGPDHTNTTAIIGETESGQMIQEYNNSLDFILKEGANPLPSEVLINIAKSLPEDTLITEINIVDIDTAPAVYIKGLVRAPDAVNFSHSLSLFLDNLNKNIRGPRPVNLQDVDFKSDNKTTTDGYQKYFINFIVKLPSATAGTTGPVSISGDRFH